MSKAKALDIEARMAAMEAKLAAAEKRAAEAEAALAAASAKPKPAPGFFPCKHDPAFERAKARQVLPNGKDITLLVTAGKDGRLYLDVTYDRRIIETKRGRIPTRGINGPPEEVAYVLSWIVSNPADVLHWTEWAGTAAPTPAAE